MRKILATLLVFASTPALANNYVGVWAKSEQQCKKEWFRVVNQSLITGPDWKCTIVLTSESKTEKVVAAFCGYDRTDVVFQDVFKMSVVNNKLEVAFEDAKISFVKCKQNQ
jgi:hypothetical protein